VEKEPKEKVKPEVKVKEEPMEEEGKSAESEDKQVKEETVDVSLFNIACLVELLPH
jgi:hypothetical protein